MYFNGKYYKSASDWPHLPSPPPIGDFFDRDGNLSTRRGRRKGFLLKLLPVVVVCGVIVFIWSQIKKSKKSELVYKPKI